MVIFKFLDILLNNNPEEKLIVKLRPSIDFVKRLKEDKINKFYTTYFNLFEIPQSIARKYVYIKMVKEDIPLNYYDKLYKELRLEFGEIIKKQYEDCISELIKSEKVILLKLEFETNLIEDIVKIQIKYVNR